MKYSSVVRTINLVIFALLFAGFAFLGIWFGFLVVPFQWRGGAGSALASDFPTISVALAMELAVLGFTGAVVAGRGLLASILSVLRPNDDEIVIRSFGAYIGVGLVAALFLFFNATWLYRLTTTNFKYDDIGFVVVVYVIAFLIIMFGTLVPLSKIFGDHERYNEIMRIISLTAGAATLSTALVFFLAFVPFCVNSASTTHSSQLILQSGLGALLPFLAAVCFFLALVGYRKADKEKKVVKLNGFLFEGGLCFTGAAIIVAGVLENVYQYKELRISFLTSQSVPATNGNYVDFAVMSYILGGILVLAALYLAYQTARGGKGKQVSAED